ncbi:MAG: MerR family transcriptional regulator, partial [Paracoccaceae bacterium]
MDKSPDAFRTISEVAELLETPAHVLRFWESRFPQIKPVKRAGGRRYYRPGDVALLAGIRRLLHDDGLTIRGVQKILREQGVRHVAVLGGEEADEGAALEAALAETYPVEVEDDDLPAPEAENAQVFALIDALRNRRPPQSPASQLPLFDEDARAPAGDDPATEEPAPLPEDEIVPLEEIAGLSELAAVSAPVNQMQALPEAGQDDGADASAPADSAEPPDDLWII